MKAEQINYVIILIAIISIGIFFVRAIQKKIPLVKAAGLCLTIGITGTFAGVTLGLLGFDQSDITSSVPELIKGLQTAFYTSLAGLGANIVLRLLYKPATNQTSPEAQILDEMKKQTSLMEQQDASSFKDSVAETLKKIVNELENIGTINQKGFDEMQTKFETFAEKLADDNSQALIDALTKVMDEFNTVIEDKLGENFKQLNQAVLNLVEWQDRYKDHVDSLEQRYTDIQENVKGIETSLENSAIHQESIVDSNKKLEEVIQEFSTEVDSFAQLGEKASEAFPVIEGNLTKLTEKAAQFVEDSVDTLQSGHQKMTNKVETIVTDSMERVTLSHKRINDKADELIESTLQNIGKNEEKLSTSIKDFATALFDNLEETHEKISIETSEKINNTIAELVEKIEKVTAASSDNIAEQHKKVASELKTFTSELLDKFAENKGQIVEETSELTRITVESLKGSVESLNEGYTTLTSQAKDLMEDYKDGLMQLQEGNSDRIKALDEELGNELTKSLESLGNSLATLSNKFAEDYGPLTNKLRRLVELSKNIEK